MDPRKAAGDRPPSPLGSVCLGTKLKSGSCFPQDNRLGQGLSSMQVPEEQRSQSHSPRQPFKQAEQAPGAQVGGPPGWDEDPDALEAHTWPGTSDDSLPPHLGLSKTLAAEEQTAVWLVDHLLETDGLSPGFAQSLDPLFVRRSAARLSVAPASSPRSQQMPPVLCSASHTARSKSGLQVTAWKDDVKNKEEHLEGRRAFSPASRHPHPHLPFCFLCSDWEPRQLCWPACQKKSAETNLD